MRIASKAPTRVDLAGGTLDIWPLYLFHPGAVTINAAITRYASCVIDQHPQGDDRIKLVVVADNDLIFSCNGCCPGVNLRDIQDNPKCKLVSPWPNSS